MFNILHGESVLPKLNPYLYLIVFKSFSIQVHFGTLNRSTTPFATTEMCLPFRRTDDKGQ